MPVRTVLVALLLLGTAIPAPAQLFRAYLSASGSDFNPCTLPAPCRLLPAAIQAVAPGGEVWMLDSANYNTGTVTIQKSATILAVPGVIGSLVAQGGTPAVLVSAAGLEVAFRNMSFSQLATDDNSFTSGVRVTAASAVTFSGCVFKGLSSAGLYLSGGARGRVHDTSFDQVQSGVLAAGDARVTISRSRFFGGGTGVSLTNDTSSMVHASVTDSVFSGNTRGIWTNTYGAYNKARVTVMRSTFESNTTALVVAVAGNLDNNAIRISSSALVGNGRAWSHNSVNAAIISTGDNVIGENDLSNVGALTTVSGQ